MGGISLSCLQRRCKSKAKPKAKSKAAPKPKVGSALATAAPDAITARAWREHVGRRDSDEKTKRQLATHFRDMSPAQLASVTINGQMVRDRIAERANMKEAGGSRLGACYSRSWWRQSYSSAAKVQRHCPSQTGLWTSLGAASGLPQASRAERRLRRVHGCDATPAVLLGDAMVAWSQNSCARDKMRGMKPHRGKTPSSR